MSFGELDRRGFLQVSAAAAAGAGVSVGAGLNPAHAGAVLQEPEAPAAASKLMPTRTLGKTGVKVSMLNMGTWQNPAMDRLVRFSYARGVRYFDTAKSYGTEPGMKRWFQATPEVRKEIFLVTKDHPRVASDMLRQVDERLANLGTDYIDMLFIHALGDRDENEGLDWPKSKEFKEAFEAIRKTGKVKFLGFSTHHKRRAEFLEAAAEGGFVDAIMLQYSPFLEKDGALNRALDSCHKKGIGLISMKQVAGQEGRRVLEEAVKRMPELKEKGMTAYQTLLHAIWTDERIASICVSMRNTSQIEDNTKAALSYVPMKQAQLDHLREACLVAGRTLCPDCDGRCSRAAGTTASLDDITRFLTYHEHHGYRGLAREMYAALPEIAKNWAGADLEAARNACPSKLNFAQLLPKAERLLS